MLFDCGGGVRFLHFFLEEGRVVRVFDPMFNRFVIVSCSESVWSIVNTRY
ncbi:hypothetical protein HXK74_04095 [Candidatus Gracilibacteria bacterium]|nr:hypothetical protein [Candidatus Gracilibacteria bacterium]